MKEYRNGMKATEFAKKDLAPIYRMAKEGTLKVEKWFMNDLYAMAEYYNFDYNGSVARYETRIMKLLTIKNPADLQTAIDELTVEQFNLLGIKTQKSADRNMVA